MIEEIPTLPAALPKLLDLIDSSDSSAGDISDAVSHDPALASKILKVANSAYYGFARTITSLEQAVAILGFRMTRSLALSLQVMTGFQFAAEFPQFSNRGLWVHSIAVATLMREIQRLSGGRFAGGHIFVIGILHDIGKIVLAHYFPDVLRAALERLQEDPDRRLEEVERELIGFDHAHVGELLLDRWRIPVKIIRPISLHHSSENPDGITDTALLRIANALTQRIHLGEGGNLSPPDILDSDRSLLSLSDADFSRFQEYLRQSEEGISDFLAVIQ
jgi:putative nucleotidyltransferase with HDIG domain